MVRQLVGWFVGGGCALRIAGPLALTALLVIVPLLACVGVAPPPTAPVPNGPAPRTPPPPPVAADPFQGVPTRGESAARALTARLSKKGNTDFGWDGTPEGRACDVPSDCVAVRIRGCSPRW